MIATHKIFAGDGAATGFRVAGTAQRTVIFVHGVGSTGAIWDRQLTAFEGLFRSVAVELRGNGISKPEPIPEAITRSGYALDVIAIADSLGVEQFDLVGCSLGGVVAFELAKVVPERMRSLTFLGSFACYPDAPAYVERIIGAARAARSMREFAVARASQLGLPAVRQAETIDQMSCKEIASYEAATMATWTGDYRDILPRITAPTLVAYGARDTIAPAQLSLEIATGITGARLVELPDAGHVANADNPAAFNAMLVDFLTTV